MHRKLTLAALADYADGYVDATWQAELADAFWLHGSESLGFLE
jgi:hypothetical protein